MTVEINYTENVLNFIKVQGGRYTKAIKEAIVEADALEIFEDEAIEALTHLPGDWVRRAGEAGPIGTQTHSVGLGGELVPVRRAGFSTTDPIDEKSFAYQPFSNGAVFINPDADLGTSLHELVHRIDSVHPLLKPIIMAHVARRLGLEPEDLDGYGAHVKPFDEFEDPIRRSGIVGIEDEYALDVPGSEASAYMWRVYLDTDDLPGTHHGKKRLSNEKELEAAREGKASLHPLEIISMTLEALMLPPEYRAHFLFKKAGGDPQAMILLLGLLASV